MCLKKSSMLDCSHFTQNRAGLLEAKMNIPLTAPAGQDTTKKRVCCNSNDETTKHSLFLCVFPKTS